MARYRPSSIDKLPPAIKETIGRLIASNFTLDQIIAHLRDMEATVEEDFDTPSRSAVGRYAERLRAAQQKMSQGRAIAEALVPQLGENPVTQVGRVASELLQGVVFDLLTAVETDEETGQAKPVQIDPKTAGVLAGVLRDVAAAQKTDSDRMAKEREQYAKEAAKAVQKVAKAKGLTQETADEIAFAVLGIAKQ